MLSRARGFTAEDLLRLPDDGFRYELVEGELRRMTPAGHHHGDVTMGLGWRLAQHVATHDLGKVYAAETGFLLARNPDTVRAPDVAFVAKARLAAARSLEGYWPGAPDLVIEVLSPSDTSREAEEKVADWLRAGTRIVLVLDPQKKSLSAHRVGSRVQMLGLEDTFTAEDVVPGWSLRIADVFES